MSSRMNKKFQQEIDRVINMLDDFHFTDYQCFPFTNAKALTPNTEKLINMLENFHFTYDDEPVPSTNAKTSSNIVPATNAKTSSNTAPSANAKTSSNTVPANNAKTSSNTAPSTNAKTSSNTAPSTNAKTSSNTAPSINAKTSSNAAPSTNAKTSPETDRFNTPEVLLMLEQYITVTLKNEKKKNGEKEKNVRQKAKKRADAEKEKHANHSNEHRGNSIATVKTYKMFKPSMLPTPSYLPKCAKAPKSKSISPFKTKKGLYPCRSASLQPQWSLVAKDNRKAIKA